MATPRMSMLSWLAVMPSRSSVDFPGYAATRCTVAPEPPASSITLRMAASASGEPSVPTTIASMCRA